MTNEARSLLLLDYDKTQAFIDKIDGLLFKIREWAITFCGAVAAYSVTQKAAPALLANAFSVLGFGLLDLTYKSFQEDAIEKSVRLEDLIHAAAAEPAFTLPEDYTFGISHALRAPSLMRAIEILANARRWHVGFLYLGLLGLTALCVVYIHWLAWH